MSFRKVYVWKKYIKVWKKSENLFSKLCRTLLIVYRKHWLATVVLQAHCSFAALCKILTWAYASFHAK